MSDERSPDIDAVEAHLRPGQSHEPRPEAERPEVSAERIPWEGSREGGSATAFVATLWRFVTAPAAAYAAVPVRGGAWRPWSFALLCVVMFGVVRQLMDVATVALMRYGGANVSVAELFHLEVAGRSLDWLPISVLSAAGCLFALGVGAPLYVLFSCLLLIVWMTIVHALLKISGGLASSEAGYQGTLRVVCYSQAAMVAAIVPWIGDEIAIVWSCFLQVIGLVWLHGCTRKRAVFTVGLAFAGAVLVLLLGIRLASRDGAVAVP
jgi:hypothetical protein